MTKEVKAVGKTIQMSPSKVRRVLDQIRGLSYSDALILVEFLPYRACGPVWQVLNAAAANASHNLGWTKESLRIKTAYADQGSTLRRGRPRAKGKMFPIRKPSCQITLILEPTN